MYLCEIHLPVDITLFSQLSIIYNLVSSHLLGTKSIPVEIRIVRFCVADVHSECVADLHDFCDVAHHRHSMQTWLSVEENRIAVHHMPMHHIAVLKTNGPAIHIAQGNMFPISSFKNLRAWIFIGTILHQFHEEFAIAIIHHNWFGYVHRNFHRNTQLLYG